MMRLQWLVDYRTRVNRSDRDRDPYGREDTIEHVEFTDGVDSDELARRRYDGFCEDGFSDRQERAVQYAISRFASIHELYDPVHYTANVERGYYGEEVRGVRHRHLDQFEERLEECLDEIRKGNIREMVFLLLEYEYGYVLDSLQDANFSEEKVRVSDLYVPNDRYAGKVSPDNYEVSTEFPVGVYRDRSVVDGYNRFVKLQQNDSDPEVYIYNFK